MWTDALTVTQELRQSHGVNSHHLKLQKCTKMSTYCWSFS